jgi:hypothetical protein
MPTLQQKEKWLYLRSTHDIILTHTIFTSVVSNARPHPPPLPLTITAQTPCGSSLLCFGAAHGV